MLTPNDITAFLAPGTREITANLRALAPTADSLALVEGAIKYETLNGRRNVILARLEAARDKLRNHPAVLSIDPGLAPIADAINTHIDEIGKKVETFRRKAMPHNLYIGVQCLAAHEKFAQKVGWNQPGPGRGKKNIVTRDNVSAGLGFDQWLKVFCPRLPRGTAYKYMQCAKGLGLTAETQFSAIAPALEQVGWPTMAELHEAGGGKAPLQPGEEPPQLGQQVFPFMREYRLAAEQVVASKDSMDPKSYRCCVAIAYDHLQKLTGRHWEPSNSPGIDLDVLKEVAL